jgi:hypothetical protein
MTAKKVIEAPKREISVSVKKEVTLKIGTNVLLLNQEEAQQLFDALEENVTW